MTWYADNTNDMFKLIELLKQKYTDVRFMGAFGLPAKYINFLRKMLDLVAQTWYT